MIHMEMSTHFYEKKKKIYMMPSTTNFAWCLSARSYMKLEENSNKEAL